MAKKFTKTILKHGTYKSPDGDFPVDAARIKHWAREHQRLTNNKQVIPVHWDHVADPSEAVPVGEVDFKNERSAKNTIGRLHAFKEIANGAEITIELSDDHAISAADSDTVFVSPIVRPEWKDGAGNEYEDIIAYMDLVDHPVDSSQSGFKKVESGAIACALRMGLETSKSIQRQIFRLANGDADMASDDTKTDVTKESTGVDNKTVEGNTHEESPSRLSAVLEALAAMDIRLSDDTSEENLLEHLEQALLTRAAIMDEGEPEEVAQPQEAAAVAPVAPVALSLAQRNDLKRGNAAHAYAEGQYRSGIASRLKSAFDSGRITEAEHTQHSGGLKAVRLSLDANQQPRKGDTERFLESREALKENAAWPAVQRMSHMVDAPAELIGNELTDAKKQNEDLMTKNPGLYRQTERQPA